jgi:nitrogen fixation-related uncharacterized protein
MHINWRKDGLNLALLALLFWGARYVFTPYFGLYEDDHTIIPNAVMMSFTELMKYIGNYIIHLSGHARPLSNSFIYLFSNLGWHLADMQGAYIIGFLIEALNISLFYLLILRVFNRRLALISTLAYALFAADTTQIFLTHSLGLQPSITLLLLAFHSYISGKKILAYLLAGIILFSYETPYLIFLAAPLFQTKWQRNILKEMALHALIMGVMLAATYQLRVTLGDDRVLGLGFTESIKTSVLHMIQGPAYSLYSYFLRPWQIVHWLDLSIVIGIILSFVAILAWLWFGKAYQSDDSSVDNIKALLKPGIIGLVMLILAYPLTFTTRAIILAGRETRVHSAAVVGAALVMGVFLVLLIEIANRLHIGKLAPFGLAGLFCLLLGFGMAVQRDYRQAWQFQREFWTKLLPLIQDVDRDTAILVRNTGLSEPAQIQANTWNLPRILNQIVTFPAEWEDQAPRVYRLQGDWQNWLVSTDNEQILQVNANTVAAPQGYYQDVSSDKVILINTAKGIFTRQTEPLNLGSASITFKPLGKLILNELPKGFLYRYLIMEQK